MCNDLQPRDISHNYIYIYIYIYVIVIARDQGFMAVYAATEMFRSGAPEKLIQERTGHRSLEALRCYERIDEAQH